jgi:metal-responsive CopG/Arc/MetJ family transcriptional regulator
MANVKTAISLQKSLLEKAETLAREMNVSRSRLLALALEEFIDRYQNQRLLEQINAVYKDIPDTVEQGLGRKLRRHHRRIVEGEW